MSQDPLAPLSALPAVVDAVAATREAVDRVLTNRVLRRRSSEVSAESALRGAWAAAVLSGAGLSGTGLSGGGLSDAGLSAGGLSGQAVDLATLRGGAVDDPIVQGALRVSAQLGPLAATWGRAPRQVLARLHVLAAADLVGADILGRPGSDPSTAAAIAARLDQLADTVTRTRAPAVVVAAVVLGEILGLDAFAPSSVVVAYGAARLSLVEFGLDPKSLCVLEVGALESRADTAAALDGFRGGTADGVVGWIAHVAGQVVLGAREAAAICTALERG